MRARSPRASQACLVLTCLALVGLLTACQSEPPSVRPARQAPIAERQFLLDPAVAAAVPTSDERLVLAIRAHGRLLDGADPEAIRSEMVTALAADPSFAPYELVAAQAEFLAEVPRWSIDEKGTLRPVETFDPERFEAARSRVAPLAERLPDYRPAVLLAARIAELRGRPVLAYERYSSLGEGIRVAVERANALETRAEDRLVEQIEEALDMRRFDRAAERLDELETFFPSAASTLDLRRRYALAVGDTEMELAAVRRLVALDPSLRQRLGELELDAGDLRAGLELLQILARENPDDLTTLGLLDRARFLWSLETIPERVRNLSRAPELDRAGLASLIHWLVPPVRFWEVNRPPIASDLMDRTNRGEILKVLDMGLLSSDTNVHRFYPERSATRQEALIAALGVVALAEPPAVCLGGSVPPRPTRTWTCDAATRCGLLDDPGECLSGATVSGTAATEILRRALDRLDG